MIYTHIIIQVIPWTQVTLVLVGKRSCFSTNVDVSIGTPKVVDKITTLQHRCLAIAGPGVVGNMLMLLDRGAVTVFSSVLKCFKYILVMMIMMIMMMMMMVMMVILMMILMIMIMIMMIEIMMTLWEKWMQTIFLHHHGYPAMVPFKDCASTIERIRQFRLSQVGSEDLGRFLRRLATGCWDIPPRKWTNVPPKKTEHFKRKWIIFQALIFRGYVNFRMIFGGVYCVYIYTYIYIFIYIFIYLAYT